MSALSATAIPMPFDRVALLSDVHGNLPALRACLADVEAARVDAVFFLGDLTWGPQPREVFDVAASLAVPTYFVRGNAERAVVEFASGSRPCEQPVDEWMVSAHGDSVISAIAGFAPASVLEVAGFGAIRLCHGSPRSDTELLTPATPESRIRLAAEGVAEAAIAHGHTHLQYQREVGGIRVIAPGSVGIPYDAAIPGARWALVDESVELRRADYDVEDAIDVAASVGYPALERYARYLRTPPTLEEIEADARTREFAD